MAMAADENMPILFVYGTLKRGDCRHDAMLRHQFLGEAVTQPCYRLYNLGSYPGLVEVTANGCEVQGELYAIDTDSLVDIDEIEGVELGLYERASVQLQSPWKLIGAETYLYLGDVTDAQEIGTIWRVEAE